MGPQMNTFVPEACRKAVNYCIASIVLSQITTGRVQVLEGRTATTKCTISTSKPTKHHPLKVLFGTSLNFPKHANSASQASFQLHLAIEKYSARS